jgi:CSLREA domain-containing protein
LSGPATTQVAQANSLTVNTTADISSPGDGLCSLRDAIQNANTDLDLSGGDCSAGSGADTITFSVTGIISLTQVPATPTHALPTITTNITLIGPGAANLTIRVQANAVGVFAIGSNGVFTLSGLTVADGLTTGSGGGIFNDGGVVTVADTTFTNNRALVNGGGIYSAIGSSTVIAQGTFSDNTTDGSGGSIYSLGELIINDSTFSNNQADGSGGAIYLNVSGGPCFCALSVRDSMFSGNSAGSNGGGIHSDGRGVDSPGVGVSDSTFSNNTAGGNGGGISTRSNFGVDRSTFLGNSALNGGGLFGDLEPEEDTRNITVDDSTFSANSATGGGGGIAYIGGTSGNLQVSDSTISNNTAGGNGGGIYDVAGIIFIERSTVSGNSAINGGGIMSAQHATGLRVFASTISGNSATLDGGGIHIGDFERFDVINSTLSANTAGRNGGGFFHGLLSLGGPLTQVTFYGNDADSGGAIFSDGSGVTLQGTLVTYSAAVANCAGAAGVQDNGHNLQTGVSQSCGVTIPAYPANALDCSSLLGPLQSNGGSTKTHALVPKVAGDFCPPGGDNPALNAVPVIDCAAFTDNSTDQRGVPRPQGAACDIGAFEFDLLPPHAVADTASTPEDTPATIDILANDSDPNATDILTVTAVSMPSSGTAAASGTTQVVYTPALNFNGTDVFSYSVSDGIFTESATVTVTINPVNDVPSISNIANMTIAAGASTGSIAFTIADVDGDALTVTATSSNTTLVPNTNVVLGGSGGSRTIHVTPATGTSGVATITVQVNDGHGGTAQDTFVLTVTAPQIKIYLPIIRR